MEWDVLKSQWERQYRAAQKYFEAHGKLEVPVVYVNEDSIPLGRWLAWARKSYAKGKLSRERIERLNAIGMTWNRAADRWEQMYRDTENYYRAHGDLLIRQDLWMKAGWRWAGGYKTTGNGTKEALWARSGSPGWRPSADSPGKV